MFYNKLLSEIAKKNEVNMLQSYQAIMEQGNLKWLDTPPPVNNARVIVTVLPEEINPVESVKEYANGERKLGFMQGEMTIPDDIHWGDDEVQKLFGIE